MHRNSSSDDDEGDTPELPSVYSFGQNAFGELALGDTIDRNKPTRIDCCSINDQSSVTDVACGNELTALLFESGDVFTCGYNDSGQCAVGSTDRVPALQLSPGLSSLGTSRLFSGNGSEHLAALSANGQLYTVGFNANGQLGIGSAKNVEEPTLVGELVSKRVVVAACSYFHTTVVTDSGELYACGCNEYGQLGSSDSDGQLVPRSVGYFSRHPVLAVACGQHFTVASLKEGGVVAFGKNDHGQLGIGRTSEPVFHPTRLASPLDKAMVPQISCGYHHTAVITEDGAVYTFGRNDYGQLGLGHKLHMARPTVVESLSRVRVVQVACGCYHTLVLSDAGKVFPFGRNNHGQLGLETSMDCLSPQLISSLQNKVVVKIAAGFYHSVCLVKTSEGAKSLGKGTETLSADLSKMLNNPTRSDVVFVVEDRRFFAHGCILAARCEPLEKMLDGRTKDGLQPAIVIPEYSFDVFAALMEFLYTDQVAALAARDLTAEFALELHGLADQYLVANLRSLCENALLRILSVENVVIVMESAHFRSAFTLKKRCARFIVDHYNRICATEAFAGLPQALLDEVLLLASHQGVAKSNQADDGTCKR
uniref:BTB domain-containing protein n=1 Tax=Peronospora matthiolae TaxID=2874970 RepID=A0AAV1SZQ0_9STRA